MTDPIAFEPLPPREAIAYFRSKGWALPSGRFSWLDTWREEHAHAFVVAKATQDDVLAMIRQELTEALEQGRTLEDFRKRLAPRLQEAGWWGRSIQVDPLTGDLEEAQLGSRRRLAVIYDTNMRTSYAAGRWARIQRTKQAFPFLQYRQIDRPTKREDHSRYDGIVLPVDHPAWEKIFPPNGWFCACSVRQLTRRQMEREGLTVTKDFELNTERLVNRRTGEVTDLPAGIHPGFDTNPGAVWLDLSARHAAASANVPEQWRAADLALAREIRARGLRDAGESLVLYDLDRPPERGIVDWNRGSENSVGLTRTMQSALRAGGRYVAIHNHPSSTGFSAADYQTTLGMPELQQLVAVGHDGSFYRMARRTSRPVPRELIQTVQGDLFNYMQASIHEGQVSRSEAPLVLSHLMALVLQRAGLISYEASFSLGQAQVIERYADFIAGFLMGIRS